MNQAGTTVAVAMSGGVDSSVAAALLAESGHQVLGIMMRLWAEEENRCCSQDGIDDARTVAGQLGIPFHLVDFEREFRSHVVDSFVDEYARGRTPNPCLACNRHLRFGMLLDCAKSLGASHLATGHYARVDEFDGCYRLRTGLDPAKDQSYVLYMLGQGQLARLLFPLGSYIKSQIRAEARRRALPVADKDESMDLCFVGDNDYRRFLLEHRPGAVVPGPILNTSGRVIGEHRGLPFYTIGQRRGLGIPWSQALYVLRLDPSENAVIVGPARELGGSELVAHSVSYPAGSPPAGPQLVQAKIRYRAKLAAASWTPLPDDRARVRFDQPMRDITPGQAVVAYSGDFVIGGGIIGEPAT